MATQKPTLNLTGLCDSIFEIDTKIKKHNDEIKALEESRKELAVKLQEEAERVGLTSGKGKQSSFTITPSIVPQVGDWDAFYKYIARTKYYHLLERRPSVTGCRELWESKGVIPGVEQFTKIKVNVKGI